MRRLLNSSLIILQSKRTDTLTPLDPPERLIPFKKIGNGIVEVLEISVS